MTSRDRPSIPFELHRIRARQIYERRAALGLAGTPEDDWEQARRELEERFWVVRDWRIQKAIEKKLQQFRALIRRLWQSFKALINGIWKILTSPFWLLTQLPQQFANTETRLYALDVVKTIISAASLIAAIIAVIGLFVNYQDSLQDRRLTQERLITDRFTKAVAQLGNSKEEVIIGGIYALERIAKDSPKDQWTIMEVLTAFVRKNSPIPAEIRELDDQSEEKIKALEKLEPVNIQLQTALTVIVRRDPDQDKTQEDKSTKTIDLSNSNLVRANLADAYIQDADLVRANLRYAILVRADLRAADLALADLALANLADADLALANLADANLRGANLEDAYLADANIQDADLFRANLALANLVDANLRGANLEDADLRYAYLADAYLADAYLRGANLEDAYLADAYLADADLFRANLRYAILVGVKNLSKTQIKSACFWEAAYYNQDRQANVQKIEEIRQDKASDPKNPPDC